MFSMCTCDVLHYFIYICYVWKKNLLPSKLLCSKCQHYIFLSGLCNGVCIIKWVKNAMHEKNIEWKNMFLLDLFLLLFRCHVRSGFCDFTTILSSKWDSAYYFIILLYPYKNYRSFTSDSFRTVSLEGTANINNKVSQLSYPPHSLLYSLVICVNIITK